MEKIEIPTAKFIGPLPSSTAALLGKTLPRYDRRAAEPEAPTPPVRKRRKARENKRVLNPGEGT